MQEYSGWISNASINTVICFQGIPKEFRGNMTVLIPMHLILNYCIHIVVKWLIAPSAPSAPSIPYSPSLCPIWKSILSIAYLCLCMNLFISKHRYALLRCRSVLENFEKCKDPGEAGSLHFSKFSKTDLHRHCELVKPPEGPQGAFLDPSKGPLRILGPPGRL